MISNYTISYDLSQVQILTPALSGKSAEYDQPGLGSADSSASRKGHHRGWRAVVPVVRGRGRTVGERERQGNTRRGAQYGKRGSVSEAWKPFRPDTQFLPAVPQRYAESGSTGCSVLVVRRLICVDAARRPEPFVEQMPGR
ncbi:hypothetical protein [Streptomyces sp. NPDC001880]